MDLTKNSAPLRCALFFESNPDCYRRADLAVYPEPASAGFISVSLGISDIKKCPSINGQFARSLCRVYIYLETIEGVKAIIRASPRGWSASVLAITTQPDHAKDAIQPLWTLLLK